MKLSSLLVLCVVLIVSISSHSYADDKQKIFMTVNCESSRDLLKVAEVLVKRDGVDPNEMMLLLSPQKTPTGNALTDSIGYFVHNKDDPGSLFAIVLWLEDKKSCLVLDGFLRRQDDPINFFADRQKMLEIIRGMEEDK